MSNAHPIGHDASHVVHATVDCESQTEVVWFSLVVANIPRQLSSPTFRALISQFIMLTSFLLQSISTPADYFGKHQGWYPTHVRTYNFFACTLTSVLPIAQHPVVLPGNLDVTMPSNHGLSQYNGIVYVHPVQGTRGPFYVITHGRLVGVIANW